MSEPTGTPSPHRPGRDHTRGFKGQPVVHCTDCSWSQALDEDLHEDWEDVLLAWHAEHPDDAVDHLAPGPPSGPLAIPAYVRWAEQYGRAVVGDDRTRAVVLFNHECLAILHSVIADGDLDGAITANARRLGTSPAKARPDIILIATNLYRKGLLCPAANRQ
ncbi:hypothetical protein AB0O64_32665 [Streptomyces sp. NPDC088341]|uniref:hypothetical protein n=1 Tax=Streptomyces sp. NPDC088341 TaxID=3154870 RepID=UPI00342B2011